MKKLFLMFIFLSAIVSCGGETKETNKCDGVSCNEWEQCNATSGVCEAKSGRCNANRDCAGTNICDANHNCVNPDNPCENQTCSAHGTCIVENNSAKCNCQTGFVADGLNCIEKTCEAGETKSISCGDNGETQNQVCENGVWKNQGTCLCVNSSTKTTTCQGDGLQYQTCVNGNWTNAKECIGTVCSTAGETREVACGFNGKGTQNQVCVNLKWTNTGTCTDPDICGNGTTQLVSNSTCARAEQICANGQWIDYEGNCKEYELALFMDIYEVTAGEFVQCITAGSCTSSNYKTNSQQSRCNLNKIGNENHPMNCVNWFGADEYCRWKGKVLPTEEEWEYAARGGEDYIYSGSNNPDEVAWYSANSGNTTHIVGTKAANGYGLYDMSGNVWEWTNSWYDSSNEYRVLRGGGFGYYDANLRVDYRHTYDPTDVLDYDIGFRCVQSH